MLQAGLFYNLEVNRLTQNGAYLIDEDKEEVLLPNCYIKNDTQPGDIFSVFVYHDSEDRLVASTEKPLVAVGGMAILTVVDSTRFGFFLNWGLPKDLFLPRANAQADVEVGSKIMVYVYQDTLGLGRVVATQKLGKLINNDDLSLLKQGDEVDIVVYKKLEVGFRAVVNKKYWGVLYNNEIFKQISLGDNFKGYISKITEDNRIDLSLQQKGVALLTELSDVIYSRLQEEGFLKVNDNTPSEEIARMFNSSKKSFKRALGTLLKKEQIEFWDDGIRIREKPKKGAKL